MDSAASVNVYRGLDDQMSMNEKETSGLMDAVAGDELDGCKVAESANE